MICNRVEKKQLLAIIPYLLWILATINNILIDWWDAISLISLISIILFSMIIGIGLFIKRYRRLLYWGYPYAFFMIGSLAILIYQRSIEIVCWAMFIITPIGLFLFRRKNWDQLSHAMYGGILWLIYSSCYNYESFYPWWVYNFSKTYRIPFILIVTGVFVAGSLRFIESADSLTQIKALLFGGIGAWGMAFLDILINIEELGVGCPFIFDAFNTYSALEIIRNTSILAGLSMLIMLCPIFLKHISTSKQNQTSNP